MVEKLICFSDDETGMGPLCILMTLLKLKHVAWLMNNQPWQVKGTIDLRAFKYALQNYQVFIEDLDNLDYASV